MLLCHFTFARKPLSPAPMRGFFFAGRSAVWLKMKNARALSPAVRPV
jgi:hypothetical protein